MIMQRWLLKFNAVLLSLLILISFQAIGSGTANLSGLPNTTLLAEQAFQLELFHDQQALIFEWQISPCCYLYQNKLQINVIEKDNSVLPLIQDAILPPAKIIEDQYFGEQSVYHSFLKILLLQQKLPIKKNTQQLILSVKFQGCATLGFCYPPMEKKYQINIKDQIIDSILPLNEEETSALTEAQTKSNNSNFKWFKVPDLSRSHDLHIITAIITFYLIGILLSFTPCVYPMIPFLLSVIVGQKHLNSRKAFTLSLTYVLSMAVTYAIAGILAATFGKNLQVILQQTSIIVSFAILFIFLGLVQSGLIKISLPHHFKLKDALHALHLKQESGTYIGAAIMGLLATLISSPCVTFPLIGALSYISQSGDVLLGGLALLALGLGMGTLLVIVGTLGAKVIPKSGPWMHMVNYAFAIMMFGLSLWLLKRVLPGYLLLSLWAFLCLFIAWSMDTFRSRVGVNGRLGMIFVLYAVLLFAQAIKGGNDPLQPLKNLFDTHGYQKTMALPFTQVHSLSEIDAQLKIAQQKGQPTLVFFSADWCTACHSIEDNVLSDPTVQQKLQSWQLIRVDLTDYNKSNQLTMSKFEVIGPPTILLFDQNGSEMTNKKIVGEISAKAFVDKLSDI